jgi:hypothetical protein
MKKAFVQKQFFDLHEGVDRKPGDVFIAEDYRADYLEKLDLVWTATITAEQAAEESAAPKKKRG